MSKFQVNTKSKDYLKDKESFLREVKHFNESKNIPFKTPYVNGIEIDLYLFYSLVQQRGGVSKVNHSDAWDSFLRPLRLPHPCVNGSTLLRKLYSTCLEKYERAKGPPGRDDDNDLDDDPRGRTRGGFPRVTYSGAYVSASGDPLKPNSKGIAGPSERLALSLLSPMPNEQDFAVNVCTVLAADYSNRLPLSTTPHILDFLLAHAGVYNHASLRETIGRSYLESRGRYPHDFWKLRAGGGGARELADETKFGAPGLEQPELAVQALAAHNNLTDRLMQDFELEDIMEKVYMEPEPPEDQSWEGLAEQQLFAPAVSGGARCVWTQRVLQVASIVRSLSFHDENLPYLARNITLLRFLLLCSNCWVGTLRQSGLDTLGNVCAELVVKDPATCLISRHILSTIQASLCSEDRARILAALEMLNKLSQNEANEEILIKSLESKVYSDVCSLLSLRDIMLLVCALECVYALTSLGEKAAEGVARQRGVVNTLVSLVTVEAQSYGPRACILMRVVETVSCSAQQNAPQPVPQSAPQTVQTPHNAPVQSQPPPPPPEPRPAPANTLQQAHHQQKTVQENEQFALAWLRASYEPLPPNDNSAVDAADLYRQYVSCCTRLQRKGVIAPTHFPRLVRSVFGGTVGPNQVTISTGETQQMYVGIKARPQQNKPNQPAGPSSPILKAQLTNKTATVEVKPAVAQVQTVQQSSHPQLSQALDGTSNTSLIKHLLANKVSPSVQNVQVAQRQQNQQQRINTTTANTVLVQQSASAMDVDPEALIKCTTIIPGGVASTTMEKVVITQKVEAVKEDPVQIQIDEQSQLTIKTAQNKMLADLLEKKSNPPLQVVQMSSNQINAPTIQITESGQIVQVKPEANPVFQLSETGQNVVQSGFIQLKNDQGQIIQIKPEQLQGQMIQVKNEQGQIVHLKSDGQGHLIQVPAFKEEAEAVADHTYTEPPSKKQKVADTKREKSPQESVSKTAANLYAALAASALEDEEDLMPSKEQDQMIPQSVIVAGGSDPAPVVIQEPILQVQQPTMQVQQPTLQVQQPTMQIQQPTLQVQQTNMQPAIQMQQVTQPTMQVQQPMLQVQPMEMSNLIASQAGQLILQDKTMSTQPPQFVQQPMQIIATPGHANQGGISYLAQNIPGNMMQKTIIIVQGATGGGPITLTVNNPGGLDEATLNSVIAQATEAITQQQIIQNSGVIQSTQRVIVSQPTLVPSSHTQSITVVKATVTQNTPQLTPSQQPIITTQPQPLKAQIVNQAQQQIVVTQKQPPALLPTSSNVTNIQGNQVISGNQQLLQGNQQIIMANNQQIIMNAPLKPGVHRVVQQPSRPQGQTVENKSVIQSTGNTTTQPKPSPQPMMRQVMTRQPIMLGGTKIGEKEVLVNQAITDVPQLVPAKPSTPTPKLSSTPPPLEHDTPWICHWRGCNKSFPNAAAVFSHAARAHCPAAATGEAPCLWADCDRMPRKTFALLNHLNDRHCTQDALKAIFNSRRLTASETESSKPVLSGYPPNAALAALNKHAPEFLNPRELMQRADQSRTLEQMDENEGPVTKSIRLTAALILRNLVIYSNTGRRQLRSHEPHLATIAMSNVEASRTIAHVLYDMSNM